MESSLNLAPNKSMNWDAEVESPATIAILGAGPTGIETAIYARFLGYEVMLFDSGRPARFVKRWHRRSMIASIQELTTSLGWAALKAQDESIVVPTMDTVWTGEEFESKYLTPLAKTDLLHDHVLFNTRVVTVGRLNHGPDEVDDMQARCNDEFYLVVESRHRGTYTARADVVVDCRGFHSKTIGLGPGGTSAVGQPEHVSSMTKEFPLNDRFELRNFLGKKTLITGFSPESLRFVEEFHQIEWSAPTTLVWLTRPQEQSDTLKFLQELSSRQVNAKVSVIPLNGYGLTKVHFCDSQWKVSLLLADDSTVEMTIDQLWVYDQAIYDDSIVKESLFVPLSTRIDRWPRPASNDESLAFATCEPHYYVMPAIASQAPNFTLQPTFQTIRRLFALLGDRHDLDLYSVLRDQSTD